MVFTMNNIINIDTFLYQEQRDTHGVSTSVSLVVLEKNCTQNFMGCTLLYLHFVINLKLIQQFMYIFFI